MGMARRTDDGFIPKGRGIGRKVASIVVGGRSGLETNSRNVIWIQNYVGFIFAQSGASADRDQV